MEYTHLDVERFVSKVDKTDTCWIWQAATSSFGYGNFNLAGRSVGAHRFSWVLENGPIPEGMFVDHLCHTRNCVNPSHLRIATRKQNGEHRKGPNRGSQSGILGVSWSSSRKRWKGTVCHMGRNYHTGWYASKADCEQSVLAKRNELYTHNNLDRAA